MPRPDEELMIAVRTGDLRAFEELVGRHQAPLLRFFVRMGADGSQAEDCTQEVFVRLYRARETYEPRAKFTTYLYRISRNYWIDLIRARASAPRPLSLDAPTAGSAGRVLGDAVADPEDVPARRELSEELSRAISGLPEGQRVVLVLGLVQGLAYDEVSQILEIPVGTVKSRMHAAVMRLREVLDARRIR